MKLRSVTGFLTLVLVMTGPALMGQGQSGSTQAGAAGASQTPASGASAQTVQTGEESPASAETPDSRAFLGTNEFSPGHVGAMRSYFLPSLSVFELMDTNNQVSSGSRQFATATSIVGRLTFGKIGRHSNISGDYYGGESFYNHRSIPKSTIHQFGFTGSYTGRRWSFTLDDRATYLPEAGFGYGGFGFEGVASGLGGAYSSNLGELNSVFNPTGALLTGRGNRILNTSVVQVQYAISSRSSISVGGSYTILHFREPGFFNTRSSSIMASYSHAINARDYLGVNYGLSLFKLQSSVPAFQTHFVQISYGHRISGRMAMQVGAGPLIQKFTSPFSGPSTQTSWMATSSLQVRARRTDVGFSFSHYTTGGSGVLSGAMTDAVRAQWSVPLSRKWQCSFDPGFSHNRSLPQTTGGGTKFTFNSFYGGAQLSRVLGRHASMFLSYNYQAQRSNTTPCLATNCESSLARHVVEFGFNFHARQITFD